MMLATLEYAKPLQVQSEMEQLIELLIAEGVNSYLEIGSRYGGSLETIVRATNASATVVDFPGGNFGDVNSAPILLATVDRLRKDGFTINDVIFGPSLAPEVRERAGAFEPYDAVMIDADHSYLAVNNDFHFYSPMARMAIIHDIAAPAGTKSKNGLPVEVPLFWKRIKNLYRHTEIIAPDTNMGIGVVWL